ncbi:MAG: hypothetical protein QOI02_531 [Actinomycetota bacterium]|jgi:hypothetical protein|nr:hypothetical protein [Actinomycetota bacterium]
MTDPASPTPPGWYLEPGSSRSRWWNGESWTDDVRDGEGSPARARRARLWIAIGVVLFLALGIGFLFIGPGILW